ncbi:MAG: hypothetical protein J4G13_14435 [Dehalococcoidia bacterium]|nr:hypothetical protein [Dehalococcoidia bacterium]
MEEVIFSCLVPGGHCEWFHLRDFVVKFNEINGTSYVRSECLDVYGEENQHPGQTPKRPEVLLECEGEVPLVIERKAVVWPSTHQRDHSKEHELLSDVANIVREEFNDRLYELSFCEIDLKGKNQRQVREFAKQIGGLIASNCDDAKSPRGIGSRVPLRWGFRPLASHEIDEPHQGVGIRSNVLVTSSWDLDWDERSQRTEMALEGFAERFAREASKAAPKFDDFADCKRLFVVQFFGESDIVNDEGIVGIIKASQVPEQIDEVWLTGREWVSLDDYELTWERVR